MLFLNQLGTIEKFEPNVVLQIIWNFLSRVERTHVENLNKQSFVSVRAFRGNIRKI